MTKQENFAAVILAAGVGSRMKSKIPKVLQTIAGKSMLRWQIDTLEAMGCKKIVVVIGPDMPEVEILATPHTCVVQQERLGTGHAAQQALPALKNFEGDVFLLVGDMPLVKSETLTAILKVKTTHPRPDLVAVAMNLEDPRRYGRMVVDNQNRLKKIVEFKDASKAERRITLCNTGIFCADATGLCEWLPEIEDNNASKEFYLTDIVEIANKQDCNCTVYAANPDEVQAANSRAELAVLEAIAQTRLRQEHLNNGVQMIAPETVFFSHDTVIGCDSLIEPHVIFGEKATIGQGVHIKGFCHIEDSQIADAAMIGPFARLRGGNKISEQAKIGNFVEIKKSEIAQNAKVNHLSYLGNAVIGANTNVGAGTITCNYDGYNKHATVISENCFVGSNATLVAPVTVSSNTLIAAGSVITDDVPSNALAFGRARQVTKENGAIKTREKLQAKQRKKSA